MKVLARILFLITLLSPVYSYKYQDDDTIMLQNMLDNGDVMLPAGRSYNVTSLTVNHKLNLNGDTINMITTTGVAIKMTADGASIANGTIKGQWDPVTRENIDRGSSAILINNDNCIINKVHITGFSAYGIITGGPFNKPVITNNFIEKTGYISFFFDAESKVTVGGIFSNNVIDRSMLPPETVKELAVGIRGSTKNGVTTSNWTISRNIIKMPLIPKDWTAECIEIRHCTNCNITNNKLVGGSIGLSVVVSPNALLSHNQTLRSKLQGIEICESHYSIVKNNSVNGSKQEGILIDGDAGSNNVQLINDTIKNTDQACIHAYLKTKNLLISNCVLNARGKGIELQNSSMVTIRNNKIHGEDTATTAVMVDSSPGGVLITGGSVSNFKHGAVTIYSRTSGLVTDNVHMTGVAVSKTPPGLKSTLENGAVLGRNINIK